ncbi:MAG: hypothetical protein H7146_09310 [Burkholderiaceae bacterium]|nr:hypothetical protein [Microbacteriaceae bacterium]
MAVLAVASVALLSAPTAAFADPYVSGSTVTADTYSLSPGETVTVTWHGDYFEPGEAVSVSVAGTAASASTMSISGARSTGATAPAVVDPSGSVVARVTVPASATGNYTITGTSASASGGVTVAVLSATLISTGTTALAKTGGNVPVGLALAGGGILALGVILVAARMITRRRSVN